MRGKGTLFSRNSQTFLGLFLLRYGKKPFQPPNRLPSTRFLYVIVRRKAPKARKNIDGGVSPRQGTCRRREAPRGRVFKIGILPETIF